MLKKWITGKESSQTIRLRGQPDASHVTVKLDPSGVRSETSASWVGVDPSNAAAYISGSSNGKLFMVPETPFTVAMQSVKVTLPKSANWESC